MLLQQKPISGYWYTNIVGQLVQVRALLYAGKRLSCVALEYANGKREFVDLDGWYYLDLALHSPRLERRERARDMQFSPTSGAGLSLGEIIGPEGPLEFTVASPPETKGAAGWAIVCHPHPLHGGSLNNKVVHYLATTFAELGMASVRFNFRGVGASGGAYDEGRGEQDDLRAVIQWCHHQDADRPLWLAGFSFGAFIATAVAAQHAPACLINVAPPVRMFDFSRFSRPACPWYIVQGTDDEIVSFQTVKTWTEDIMPPPEMIVVEDATHFFHGKLNNLRDSLLVALGPIAPGNSDSL